MWAKNKEESAIHGYWTIFCLPKMILFRSTLKGPNGLGNSYFLHWNFDWKSWFVVFFLEWNEWKNPQFNFSSQNLSIERNFFQMRWKRNQDITPTFP